MPRTTSAPSDDAHWLDVAMSIADGAPIDWRSLAESEPPSKTADLAGRLRRIERLVRGHEAVRRTSSSGGTRSTTETILTAARSRAAADDTPLTVRWGPLVVIEKIGSGSFGDVYRAWDPRLEREVALKVVPEPEASRSRAVIDEGRLLAKVRHPNVVAVYGAERVDGRAGLWMELVEGENLAQLVARHGPLEPQEAARIGLDVCRALAAVHEAGLLHRDVKAQNILRDTSGRVVLSDFGSGAPGVSGTVDPHSDDAQNEPGPAGTPLYLAPELFTGDGPSVQSDLYSVGVLLFFLLTGGFPVNGRSLGDVRAAHRAERRRPLILARPDAPSALVEVVDRLLAPEPGDRYSSAIAVMTALDDWLAPREKPRVRRYRTGRSATALGVAALGILALAVWWGIWPTGGGGATVGALSRQVLDAPCPGVPSLEGTWLCSGREPDAPLVLFDSADRTTTTLAVPPPGTGPVSWVLSPTGQQAAYVAFSPSSRSFELRVYDVTAGEDRVLVPGPAADVSLRRWTPDGRIEVGREIRTTDGGWRWSIELLDPSRGTFEKIFELPDGGYGAVRSPDGRLLVFERADALSGRGLQLCEIESGTCRAVAPHPASNFSAAFAPDGSLLFNSDRTGTNGLWRVELDGLEMSPPELVRDLGRMQLRVLGFAADGAMHYELSLDEFDIFSAGLDLENAGTPVRLSPAALGSARSPAWSPDGQSLAYLRRPGPGIGAPVRVVIQSRRDGSERGIPVDARLQPNFGLAWSPDGTVLALRTLLDGSTSLYGIRLLDPEDGRLIRTITRPGAPTSRDARFIDDAIWRDDERLLLNVRRGVVELDIGTNGEAVIWRNRSRRERLLGRLALSPDRAMLAFVTLAPDGPRPDGPGTSTVSLLSLTDGSVSDLLVERLEVLPRTFVQAFSADGKALYVTRVEYLDDWRQGNYQTQPARLWRVPLDGGEPVALQVTAVFLDEVAPSPDGRRVAYSARVSSPDEGLWIDHITPARPPGR